MKMDKEIMIISGFMGFAIGACTMMLISVGDEIGQIEKFDEVKFVIQENITTCEDMIEWMDWDVENYADTTVFDTYIINLEQMCEDSRSLLYTLNKEYIESQTKYDY